jgi:hypothetical protein
MTREKDNWHIAKKNMMKILLNPVTETGPF